ncbi:hypothetical protein QN277_018903 [Acacia crassicarpa]|uniref:CCHC-type domain-containing protein n=1 Tax=Acacia crassicarpa TaxID=499986 RepID=A0AAE1JRJ1_9FABA|nr:hypothetical protein QN277_018903 [Acacia crassicarpa]
MEEGQSSGSKHRNHVVLTMERCAEQSGGILVGKILTSKSLNFPTVIAMIKKSWNLDEEMEIHELDRSQFTFLFRFHHERDYARVLTGRPWSIQGCLLNLQNWEEFMVLEDVKFGEAPFWVQFHGLPLEAFDDANAKILGDAVGECVMYEKPRVGGRLGRGFIHVCSLLQLNEPLRTGFWVPRAMKTPAWVTVKYERLPDFCYNCGCIGHKDRVCKIPCRRDMGDDGEKEFGSWISTAGLRTIEEAVEVCGAAWCEARFMKGKQPALKSRRSEISEKVSSGVNQPNPCDLLCQRMFRADKVSADPPALELRQGNSADCDVSGERVASVDQNAFTAEDFMPSRDMLSALSGMLNKVANYVDSPSVAYIGSGLNGDGPAMDMAQSEAFVEELKGSSTSLEEGLGSIEEMKGSPTALEESLGYHVEFPSEQETTQTSLIPFIGLSPIAAITNSLRSCHLKRSLDDLEGPATTKRQRKLSLEDNIIQKTDCSPAKLQQRVRRRNFRGLKSLICNRQAELQTEARDVILIGEEVAFPVEGLNRSDGTKANQYIASSQNAGGWIGPTTGAP